MPRVSASVEPTPAAAITGVIPLVLVRPIFAAVSITARVAQAAKFPEWKPGTEFRAKREAMVGTR